MWLKIINLSLLVLFPVSWFAPLIRAGFLPLFGLEEISVVTGLQALWESDVFLALLVTFFAIFAPILKTAGIALIQFNLMDARIRPVIAFIGKLAMADIFLIALYIVVLKGVGIGKVETAWGLYLFSACVIASIILSMMPTTRSAKDS